jgi:hypothetical protein
MNGEHMTDAERLQIRLLASIAEGIRLLTAAPSNPSQWQSGVRDLYDKETCKLLSHVTDLLERD